MTRAAEESSGVPIDYMERLSRAGFSLLPLGGGEDGKSPRVKFKGKSRLTLGQVLGPMRCSNSQCYGVRLEGLAVIDCDVDDVDLIEQLETRFGASSVHVKTPRGRHLYYRHDGAKLPDLRAEGLEVDIKSGQNSYVVGPGSVRPDGSRYILVKGDLVADELPMIKIADAVRVATSQEAQQGLIPEGERNSALWREAIQMVELVDDVDELAANLRALRDNQCENPDTVTDSEIAQIASWAWKCRLEGKLYRGRDSSFPVDRAAVDALRGCRNASDAISLYIILLDLHGHRPGKTFALDGEGMKRAGLTDLSRDRFRAARQTLEQVGLLQIAASHQVGKRNRTYQLAKPLPQLSNVARIKQ